MSNTYVTSGLLAYFNPKDSTCYPGTGTTLTSLQGSGVTGTLSGTYSLNSNGTIRMVNNRTNYPLNASTLLVSTLTDVRAITMWIRIESIPSNTTINTWRYLLDGRTGATDSWIASSVASNSVGTAWLNGTYFVNDGAPLPLTRMDMIDLLSITGVWMCVTLMNPTGMTDDFNFFATSMSNPSSVGLDCSFGPILMYNRELTAAEVHQNYQAYPFAFLRRLTYPFVPRVSNGLVAYFNLNNVTCWPGEAIGTTLNSIVGSGITGTLGGTYYVNSNGTVRIVNTNTNYTLNQSGLKVTSVTGVRTISLWFRIESIPVATSGHRHLLDARWGLSDGWIASAAVASTTNNGIGNSWRNGTFYVNGGIGYPITRQNMIDVLGVVGTWMNVTLICDTAFTEAIEFFMTNITPVAGQFGYEGLDVTMGPILMYNRALTETEVQQNFLASEFFFLRQWTKYPSMPLKANVSNGYVASASSEVNSNYQAYMAFDQTDADYGYLAIPGKMWHSSGPGYDYRSGQVVDRRVSFSSDTGRMLNGPTLRFAAGGFTAMAWVRMTGSTLGSYERVFDFGNGAGIDNIGIGRNDTNAVWQAFVFNNNGSTTLNNPTVRAGTIQQNIWTLLTLRYTTFPAQFQLYQDGTLVGTDSQAYPVVAATASTWSSYTALASTEYNTTTWAAWKAFDNSPYTSWHSVDTTGTTTPYNDVTGLFRSGSPMVTIGGVPRYGEWLQIRLPVSIHLGYFTLSARSDDNGATWYANRVPQVFYVGGWNGSAWDLLYAQTDTSFTWTSITQTFTLNPAPTTAYSWFIISINYVGNPGTTSRGSVQIGDWKLGNVLPARTLVPTTSSGNYIGRSNFPGNASANMDLAGLLLYDRELTDTEITTCTAVLKGQSPPHELPTNAKVQLLMRDLLAQPFYQGVSNWNTFTQTNLSLQPVYNVLPYTMVDNAPLAGEWLQLQLPTAIVPSSVLLTPRRDNDNPSTSVLHAQRSPSTFVIAGSNDGVNWKLVYGSRSFEWLTENSRLITLPQTTPLPGLDYPYHNLTSASFNGYSVTTSSATGNEGWYVFDGTPDSYWHSAFDNAAYLYNPSTGIYSGTTTTTVNRVSIAGEWLQISFPQDYQSFLVTGFRIAPRRDSVGVAPVRSPRYFVLAASNDNGVTWVSLFDNRSESPGANAWTRTTALTFSLSTLPTVTYTLFRLIVTRVGNFDTDSGNNQNTVQISEFRLIGQPAPATTLLYPLIDLTANTTGGYVASASTVSGISWPAGGVQPFCAFDSSTATMYHSVYHSSVPNIAQYRYNATTGIYPSNGLSTTTVGGELIRGEWLQLQFPNEYANFILTGFRILPRQDVAGTQRSPRNFVLAGSPDGTLWTNLFDNRAETGANDWGTSAKVFTLSTAQIPVVMYRYYRLVVTRVGNADAETTPDTEKSLQIAGFRFIGRPVNLTYFPLAQNNTGVLTEMPNKALSSSNGSAMTGILQSGSRSGGIATVGTNYTHNLTVGMWVAVASNVAAFNTSSALVTNISTPWVFSYVNPGSDNNGVALTGSLTVRASSADVINDFAANASSSSVMGSYGAHLAFDGSATTMWHSVYDPSETDYLNFVYNSTSGVYAGQTTTVTSGTTLSGEWLQLQLPPEHETFLLTGFRITPRTDNTGTPPVHERRSPRNFALVASADGMSWTTLFSNIGETGVNNWTPAPQTFSLSSLPTTSYRYYRLVVTRVGNYDSVPSNTQHSVQISDFKLLGYSPRSTAVTTLSNYTTTANAPSSLTESFVDVDVNTFWPGAWGTGFGYNGSTGQYSGTSTTISSGRTISGDWLQMQFLAEQAKFIPTGFRILPRQDASYADKRSPRNFVLAASPNGTNWVTLFDNTASSTGINNWTLAGHTFVLPTPPTIAYRYYRLIVTRVGNYNSDGTGQQLAVQIADWRLIGEPQNNEAFSQFRIVVPCVGSPSQTVYRDSLQLTEWNIFGTEVEDLLSNGLLAYFNPNLTTSYSGTGNTLQSTIGTVTATLSGTYSFTNGTIRLTNTSATDAANTSRVQLSTARGVRTVSVWFRLETTNTSGTRVLLDARTGATNGLISNTTVGSDWANSTCYVNEGKTLALTLNNLTSFFSSLKNNAWTHLTLVSNAPFNDDLTLFADYLGASGVDCTFGPILLYNRALTLAEHVQIFNAPQHTYLRNLVRDYVVDGLIAYFNPNITASFSGSGSTLTSLVGTGVTATLAGVSWMINFQTGSGTILLSNTSATASENTSRIEVSTLSNIRTISFWFKVESARSGLSRVLLGSGSDWTNGLMYVNGGNALPITTANINTLLNRTNAWWHVTFVSNLPFDGGLILFAGSSLNAGVDCFVGPIMVYNRVLSRTENIQNYQASAHLFFRGMYHPLRAVVSGDANTEVGYFITASSSHASGNYGPLKLLDKTTDGDSAWVTSENATNLYSSATGLYLASSTSGFTASGVAYKGEWFEFQLSTAISLSSLTLTPRQITTAWESSAPTSFIVAASNTGSDWTVVYTSGAFDWANRQTRAFTLPQPTSAKYFYFRVLVLKVGNSYLSVKGTTVMIGEVAFCERDMTLTRFPVLPLTANTSNGYVASSSSVVSAGYEAFNQHDLVDLDYTLNQSTTSGYHWHSATTYNATTGNYTGAIRSTVNGFDISGEYVQLQLPSAVLLSAFMITPRRSQNTFSIRSPRDFSIAASNDGANWDLVYRAFNTVWANEYPRTFILSSPTAQAYTYYRLIIESVGNNSTSGSSQDSVQITEWALYGQESTTAAYYHPIIPLLANESVGYVASASSAHSAPYNAFKAFDLFSADYDSNLANLNIWSAGEASSNAYNSTSGLYAGVATTQVDGFSFPGEWLQLELPYRITLTQFRLTPRRDAGYDARSPTDFIIAGSNDGYRWTVVYSTVGLISWASEDPRTFTVTGVNTAYKFFRLIAKILGNTGVSNRTVFNLTEWNLYGPEMTTNTDLVSVTSSAHKYGDPPLTLSSSLRSGIPAWVSFTRASLQRLQRTTPYSWNMNLGFTAVTLVRFRADAAGSGFERIFDFAQGPNSINYNISLCRSNSTAVLRFQFVSAGPTNAVATLVEGGNIVRNAWTLIACRYEYNSRMELYQNNSLVGLQTNFSAYLPAGTISRDINWIGHWNGQDQLQGDIAGLLVYNRALSPAELTTCGQILLGATTASVPLNPVYNLQASSLTSAASNSVVSSWGTPAFTQSVSGVQPIFQKTLVQYTSSNTSVSTVSNAVATFTGVGAADVSVSDSLSNSVTRTLNVSKGDQLITFPNSAEDVRPPILSYFGSFAAGGTSQGQTTQSSDGYTVTVSTNYVTNSALASGLPQGGSPLYAFDGDLNSYWHSTWGVAGTGYNSSTGVYIGSATTTSSGQSIPGDWIQIQFPTANFVATGFRIAPRWSAESWVRRSPRHFALVAGNDGTSWTTLFDNRSTNGITNWTASAQLFALPDLWNTSFLYYRLVISRVGTFDADPLNDQVTVQISDFRLLSNLVRTMVDADFDLGVTASSGLPVTLTSSNPAVAAVLPSGAIDALTLGSTVITASQPGNDLYFAADDVQRILTITRAAQSITFSEFTPRTYSVVLSQNAITLPSTASSGLALTYTSSNPAVASVAGNVLTVLKSGTTNITATQSGDGNYSAAVSVVRGLTVNMATQTVTFSTLPLIKAVGQTFSLAATSSLGLPITYSVSPADLLSLTGTTATVTAAGTATITASQAGQTEQVTAASASQTLTLVNTPNVIVGLSTDGNGSLLFSSDSGYNYLSANTYNSGLMSGRITSSAYNNATNRLIVVSTVYSGSTTYMAYSDDRGLNWTNLTNLPAITFYSPAETMHQQLTCTPAGTWLFSYNGTNTLRSTDDGLTWQSISGGSYGNAWNPVSRRWVRISGSAEYSDDNGVTWQASSGFLESYVKTCVRTIVRADGTPFWVTASNTYGIYWSEDGITWTRGTNNSPVRTIYDIGWNGSYFLAVGHGYNPPDFTTRSVALQSYDGQTWDLARNNVAEEAFYGIEWTGSVWIIATNRRFVIQPFLRVSSDLWSWSAFRPMNTTITTGTNTLSFPAPTVTQVLTFASIPSKTFGTDVTFTLTASASSTLTVRYESSATGVATVSGNQVTLQGVGETTITAYQDGDSVFSAASPVSQVLLVKQDQLITFTLSPQTYAPNLTVNLPSVSSAGLTIAYTSSDPTVATIAGNTLTVLTAGQSTITATQAGNTSYNAAPSVSQTLNVARAPQIIPPVDESKTTASEVGVDTILTKTYGTHTTVTLPATTDTGHTISYTSSNPAVATISGNLLTIQAAGVTDVTASQAGDTNYLPATPLVTRLIVQKADQSITFSALPRKLLGEDTTFSLSASASSGLSVAYESVNTAVATVSGNLVTLHGAGQTRINVTQPGNTNYNAATLVYQILSVNKARQTLALDAFTPKTYTDVDFELTGSASSGLAVAYTSSDPTVATVTGSTVDITGVGSTIISVTQGGNTDYNPVAEPLPLTNDNNVLITEISGSGVFTVALEAGTYTFAQIAAGLQTAFGNLSLGLVVTYSALTRTFQFTGQNGTQFRFLRSHQNGLTNLDSGIGSLTFGGAYQSSQQVTAPVVYRTLTVNRAAQSLTFPSIANKTYLTDTSFSVNATASSGLTPVYTSSDETIATVSGSTVTVLYPGTVTITANQSGDGLYLAAAPVAQTFTVQKATAGITAQAFTVTYHPTVPYTLSSRVLPTSASTGAFQYSLAANEVYASLVSGGTALQTLGATPVGTLVTLTVTQLATLTHAQNSTTVSVTISKAAQPITFASIPLKTYSSDTQVSLVAESDSGLPIVFTSSDPSVATISGSTATIHAAGNTTITATQSGNTNYLSASATQLLTVSKAAQTLTFTTPINKIIGDSPFTLSASTSAQPSYASYTFSVPPNNGIASLSGNTVTILAAGQVEITVTQAANSNFLGASTTATLIVAKKSQVLTALDVYRSYDDPPFFPTVSTNATTLTTPAAYTLSVQNPTVATVENGLLRIQNVGSTLVTLSHGGDDTYSASSVTFTFTVEYGRRRALLNLYDSNSGLNHFQIAQEYTRTVFDFPTPVRFVDPHRSVETVVDVLLRIPQLEIDFDNRLADTLDFEQNVVSLASRIAFNEVEQLSMVTQVDTLEASFGSLHSRVDENEAERISLTSRVDQTLTSTLSSMEYMTTATVNGDFTGWTILAREYLSDGTRNTSLNTDFREFTIDDSGMNIFVRRETDFVRSNDGGTTWSLVANAPQVSRFAVSFSNSTGNVIVGYGYNVSATVTEFYRTQNKGQSWTALTFPASITMGVEPIIRFTQTGMYLAYNTEVYFSSDVGSTWTLRSTHSNPWVDFVTSTSGHVLFASDEVHVYSSTDGAITWTQRTTVAQSYGSLACTEDGHRVFAILTISANRPIYTSTNGGVTWTTFTNLPSKRWAAVSCSGSGDVICASSRGTSNGTSVDELWLSVDYGSSWSIRDILRPNPASNSDYVRGIFWLQCSRVGNRVFGLSQSSRVFLRSSRTITRVPVSPYLRTVKFEEAFASQHTRVEVVSSSAISLTNRVDAFSLQLETFEIPQFHSLITTVDELDASVLSTITRVEEYEMSLAYALTRVESNESLLQLTIDQQDTFPSHIHSLTSRIDEQDTSWTTLLSEMASWPSTLLAIEATTITADLPVLDSRISTLEQDVSTVRTTLHAIVDADADQHFSTLQEIVTFFGTSSSNQDVIAVAQRISYLESVVVTLVSKLP